MKAAILIVIIGLTLGGQNLLPARAQTAGQSATPVAGMESKPVAPAVPIPDLIIDVTSSPDGTNKFSLAGIDYSTGDALEQALTSQGQANPHLNVVIRADRNVPYSAIKMVLDACKGAGISPFFATAPPAKETLADPSAASPNTGFAQIQQPETSNFPAPAAQPSPDSTPPALELPDTYWKARLQMILLKAQLADLSHRLKPKHPAIIELNRKIQRQQEIMDAMQSSIDWKSFCLGIAATVLSLLAAIALFQAARRLSRLRHERELRRIASLDG